MSDQQHLYWWAFRTHFPLWWDAPLLEKLPILLKEKDFEITHQSTWTRYSKILIALPGIHIKLPQMKEIQLTIKLVLQLLDIISKANFVIIFLIQLFVAHFYHFYFDNKYRITEKFVTFKRTGTQLQTLASTWNLTICSISQECRFSVKLLGSSKSFLPLA